MSIADHFGRRREGRGLPELGTVRPRALSTQLPTNEQQVEAQNIAAVEVAIDPRPMPNSKDAVVQAFMEMGANIATAMRKAGDFAAEQGERRKNEYYKAAEVAERKAEFQAREAGEYIDTQLKIEEAINPVRVIDTQPVRDGALYAKHNEAQAVARGEPTTDEFIDKAIEANPPELPPAA